MSIFNFTAQTCDNVEPLVTGVNPIPDAFMTSSSTYRVASSARLHGTWAWKPSPEEESTPVPTFYLQVSLDISLGCYRS